MDIKELLAAFNSVAGVIKTVAGTPGISMIPIAGTVSSAVSVLQVAVNAGVNIAPYVLAIKDTFIDGPPPPEKLAALDAKIAELEALVDAPLPPKEAGEKD